MKNPIVDLREAIFYVDIGEDSNTDLFRWKRPNSVLFRMDIIAARAEATEEYYRRLERSNVRTLFIKKNKLVFTIASDDSVQFQLLEALLEEIILVFFDTYGTLSYSMTGMSSLFEGFQSFIFEIFDRTQRENVKWVMIPCKLCKTNHPLCINKSLIDNAQEFPISIVYLHKGVGLTIFIDANIKVRGVEPVTITG